MHYWLRYACCCDMFCPGAPAKMATGRRSDYSTVPTACWSLQPSWSQASGVPKSAACRSATSCVAGLWLGFRVRCSAISSSLSTSAAWFKVSSPKLANTQQLWVLFSRRQVLMVVVVNCHTSAHRSLGLNKLITDPTLWRAILNLLIHVLVYSEPSL